MHLSVLRQSPLRVAGFVSMALWFRRRHNRDSDMTEMLNTRVFLGMRAVICSEPMCQLLELVKRYAAVDATVLVTGESGSGKELIARALHHHSRRTSQPWVDVSCAALPEHLVESELFGREKGAYSSAESAKPGLFELAHRGTLLLDEIGDLEPRMQVKLLRVLDGVPYYRLGGTRKVSVDVRVVAATNHDLAALVSEGRFRSDLYHRLTELRIQVPPLRERRADIIPLAQFFLAEKGLDCRIAEDGRRALEAHYWPGNVRELRNFVLRAGILANGRPLRAGDLADLFRESGQRVNGTGGMNGVHRAEPRGDLTLEGMERRMIRDALERTGGHQQRAAELLGISRRTLSRKLKTYATESDSPAVHSEAM